MNYKILIQRLGFIPKESSSGIFIKKYADAYAIEVDFEKETFHFGGKIKVQGKDSQNITKPEDWVVLECVNRLLEKGYKPENISLEKVYPAGHGFSGRLDVCVTDDDGKEYLLIECKTYGAEFNKALTKLNKDGGQLFTYFKFGNKADVIMLYASELKGDKVVYKNEIVKIEDDYRSGDVKDFYDKWNKLTKDNGIFEDWVNTYNFESKALTINELVEIKPEDSSFIFNRFLEILRHNVVSDKGNAFNKIFTLFLCKIYDEKDKEGTNNELEFQWIEGEDHRTFQLRLTDLYKKGMYDFLEKRVTDFSETEFNNKFNYLKESDRTSLLDEFRKIRLEKNNEFAIKDVYDEQSFNENAVVVKEVVELLQKFKIRYTKKQQYLSDFFELLLTTGLKQESGQFFTPVPVAQFIIKSLPIDAIVEDKLNKGVKDELLPYVMDYAAGSGHFLTEAMHEIQRLLDKKTDASKLKVDARKFVETSRINHFDWALHYVYGIEKDYRLVKVGKVGCYLHGDGLANVIHSDGLSRFAHPDYKGKLLSVDKVFKQDNKEFDIIISNPPYSVSSFKNTTSKYYTKDDFELYNKLTDNSSEIECLFIERTKQLLKDGGVAGIILPSSILSNTGIYSKSREIILQHFDILAITELGSNTFMATGTNTVVLFLRRKDNYRAIHLKHDVGVFFTNKIDVTLNSIEKPVTKYVNHVWEGIVFEDYLTLLQKTPNKTITEHEIYKEYQKKLKAKNDKEFWTMLLEKEADKLFYFIIAYPQKVVLIKSGEKDAEKRFLGYEFSNRRGSEGIHAMQRGKNIEDCTQLFDPEVFDNPTKASTYIYKAFQGDFDFPIDATMQNNVTRHNLVDMLTFDRVEFEKNMSLSVKKKVKIESKWEILRVSDICEVGRGRVINKKEIEENFGDYPVYSSQTSNNGIFGYLNTFDFDGEYVTWTTDGIYAGSVFYRIGKFNCTNVCGTLKAKNGKINMRFLSVCLPLYTNDYVVKVANPKLMNNVMASIQIPLPPKEIQQKIVAEIEVLEMKEKEIKDEIEILKIKLIDTFNNSQTNSIKRLDEVCEMKAGDFVKVGDINKEKVDNLFPCYGGNGLRGYVKTFTHEGLYSLVGRQGALCGNVHLVNGKFHATEHALVVKPLHEVNTNWLHHKLVSMNLNQYATGTAQPGLSVINLKPIEIKLPLLSEQQKIVSEIEKIEAKINALENEIAQIPQLKEAVLMKYL